MPREPGGTTIGIGYALSSEEHGPKQLIEFAQSAEKAGFTFASISDHFHPWTSRQGNSPFVWSVIGAIAEKTDRLKLFTGVTCPLIRIHPAIIAQAAATCEALMPGRFSLGLGTGENLNEHIFGDYWPPSDLRIDMLEEAIGVIRQLWQGDETSHRGRFYKVEDARIYSLPEKPPPILIAAKGPRATELAATQGDGLVSTIPDPEQIEVFDKNGGEGKPRYGMLHVCWAPDEAAARRTAFEWWPNSAVKGELTTELSLPRHFEQAAEMLEESDVAEAVICGPDPAPHVEGIREYLDAGFDHVYVHQIGADQQGFFDFYARQVLPAVSPA